MRKFALLTLLPLLGACSSAGPDSSGAPADCHSSDGDGSESTPPDPSGGVSIPDPSVLEDRVVSYTEALRTASLKLVQNLPTLQQIKSMDAAADRRAAYEAAIDVMLSDPRFTARMIKYWRDTMRQGGGAGPNGAPSRDTAPVFAARVLIEERPYKDLFTATTNTCPTYDVASNTFANGECGNAVETHAGVLTNPGVMMQFQGNMAFRRVRWVQEIFVCNKFPAEYSATPEQIDGADYTAPWAFESVASSPINFQDTSSVVCANCHASINRIAPLFANFDANGQWHADSQVTTPTVPSATTELSHWLRPGETTAWRFGSAVADLPSLGQAMAADPDVEACAVARMYNFAMSKEDIVSDSAIVPTAVLSTFVDQFRANGMNLKKTLRAILVSEDFVKF